MPPKILFIDDEPIFHKIVEIRLRRAGFCDLGFVQDSIAAVETIRRERPDLVLLDISMPGVSGLDVLKEMQDDRDLRNIPVLMVTASVGQRRQQALDCGARAIVGKPIDAADLVGAIREVTDCTVSDAS